MAQWLEDLSTLEVLLLVLGIVVGGSIASALDASTRSSSYSKDAAPASLPSAASKGALATRPTSPPERIGPSCSAPISTSGLLSSRSHSSSTSPLASAP